MLLLLLLFTHVQHIVRTYDSRQSCLWSAEQGDQMKNIMRHTHRHTKPLPAYLTSSTFQSAATEGGRSISPRKRKNRVDPFLTPSFIVPNKTRLGSRPSSMRVRVPAHNNLLARNVASKRSHPVSSSARLYERTRWSNLRRLAPMMRSRTLWWTARNFL